MVIKIALTDSPFPLVGISAPTSTRGEADRFVFAEVILAAATIAGEVESARLKSDNIYTIIILASVKGLVVFI